jgi:hypothetical protein
VQACLFKLVPRGCYIIPTAARREGVYHSVHGFFDCALTVYVYNIYHDAQLACLGLERAFSSLISTVHHGKSLAWGRSAELCVAGMPETPRVGEAQTKKASAARGQAIRREVFQVGVRGQQNTQAQTKCAACGLWVVSLSVDTVRSLFTCNTRCMRRWQLDQIAAFLRQEPRQEWVCGCGDRGSEEKEDPPSARMRTQCNSGLTPFGSPLQQACAG